MKRAAPRAWTQAELELLRRHYADSMTSDLAVVLGRGPEAVYRKAHALGLRKSPQAIADAARASMLRPDHPARTTCFKKGNVPANKGLRRPGLAPGRMAETWFRRGACNGRAAQLVQPLGSYRVDADGYLDRKVSETPGPQTLRWKAVHRLVWEAAHGPVPPGYIVAFLPGRRTTDPAAITPDALELISRVENMRRNTIHNLPKPLADVIRLRGALNRQINARSEKP